MAWRMVEMGVCDVSVSVYRRSVGMMAAVAGLNRSPRANENPNSNN
jgi:hypothetical protein